jgi:hypothetical protein
MGGVFHPRLWGDFTGDCTPYIPPPIRHIGAENISPMSESAPMCIQGVGGVSTPIWVENTPYAAPVLGITSLSLSLSLSPCLFPLSPRLHSSCSLALSLYLFLLLARALSPPSLPPLSLPPSLLHPPPLSPPSRSLSFHSPP